MKEQSHFLEIVDSANYRVIQFYLKSNFKKHPNPLHVATSAVYVTVILLVSNEYVLCRSKQRRFTSNDRFKLDLHKIEPNNNKKYANSLCQHFGLSFLFFFFIFRSFFSTLTLIFTIYFECA